MKITYKTILNQCKDKCPDMKGIFVDDCNICIKKVFDKYYSTNTKQINLNKFINKLLLKLDTNSYVELINYILDKNSISIDNIKNKKLYLLAIALQKKNKTFKDIKLKI